MGVFDIEGLKKAKKDKNEVIEWCVDAVSDFLSAARASGLDFPAVKYKGKVWSSISTNEANVTYSEKGFPFTTKWIGYYVILSANVMPDQYANDLYGVVVTVTNGYIYVKNERASSRQAGELIADVCGYNLAVAQELFQAALLGNPWSVNYAIEQAKNAEHPNITVRGNHNTVGGRDVYLFGKEDE